MRPLPDPDPGTPDLRSPLRYLTWLAGRSRAAVVLGVVYGIACMLAQALVPTAIGRAVDNGLIARDATALWIWGGAVLGLGVVQAVTSILRDRCSLSASLTASYRTVQLLTRRTGLLGASLARRVSAGETMSAGAIDATRIGRALEILGHGVGALVAVCVVAAVMLGTSWQLGLVVLVGVPVMGWAVGAVIRPLHGRQVHLRDEQSALTSRAVDIVGGLRVLRGLGGEEAAAARYRADSQSVRGSAVRVARLESLLGGIQELLPGLLMVLVVWLGGRFVTADSMSVGQLVVFYAYTVFLSTPLRLLTVTADRMAKAFVAAGRVTRLLSLKPDVLAGDRKGEPMAPPVGMTEPESGLRVRAAAFTGIVCENPEMVAALAGRLGGYGDCATRYGDTALSDLPLEVVRHRILVDDDDAHLFSGTLREELDPADRSKGSDRLLLEAICAASADDIVEGLPTGLAEAIVQGGREFSGGQQQRLRLARALMADPDVLVLVEPTSAVDAHTESRIAWGLKSHRRGRTTVVFTTSPVLLNAADQVVYVEGGSVVVEGSHTALLTHSGYRSTVRGELV